MSNIDELIETDRRLATYDGEDAVVESRKLLAKLRERERQINPVSMSSGIGALDYHIQNFRGGELTTISGPTGHGKTLFAATLTSAFADQGFKSVWFPYEVTGQHFLELFGDDLPVFFLPQVMAENHLKWVRERIHEAIIKYQVTAVFIDHLHYLIDLAKMDQPSLRLGSIMRQLHSLAGEFNISIFLIAHLAKVPDDREPNIHDIRDSSFIPQESDNVFIIWRRQDEQTGIMTDEARLKIVKNRRFGAVGHKIYLQKHGPYLYAQDAARSEANGGT